MSITQHNDSLSESRFSRRSMLQGCATGLIASGLTRPLFAAEGKPDASQQARPWIKVRGIYGGFPDQILERGETPADYGVNAIWVGSSGLNADKIDRFHKLGVKVFAEFNSMHFAAYLKDHPDAAPIGPDGKPSPPPHGWQGVSPFHAAIDRTAWTSFAGC